MKTNRPTLEPIPDRYKRDYEYEKESKINVIMTKELHKDMKRILLEQDETWQAILEELLMFYALTHQDQVPPDIRKLTLSQMGFDSDRELKEFAKKRLKEFNEYRPARESFGKL